MSSLMSSVMSRRSIFSRSRRGRGDIQHFGADDLATAERQQLARQGRSPLRPLLDLMQAVEQTACGGELRLELADGQLHIPEDGCQNVVEVMGHTPGQTVRWPPSYAIGEVAPQVASAR